VKIAAVLFDAGNTLLFLDYERLAREVGPAVGVPLTAQGLEAQSSEAALQLERSDTSDHDRASRYLESLFLLAGVPREKLGLVRDTLLRLHGERHLWSAMHPGTPAALARMRQAGLRLGVVSNSDGRVEEALAAAGIRANFEVIVDSRLVGFEKPDPRIFQAALEPLGIAPEGALYVGDIYEVDVIGARRAGMDVVLLDPAGNHAGRDVQTVSSIAAVADLILSLTPEP
jgi:putative hydrolase of the HAD superfamily